MLQDQLRLLFPEGHRSAEHVLMISSTALVPMLETNLDRGAPNVKDVYICLYTYDRDQRQEADTGPKVQSTFILQTPMTCCRSS